MNLAFIEAIQRGHCYCYFNPQDLKAKDKLKKLTDAAWYRGILLNEILRRGGDKTVERMTDWEILYCFKDLIDINNLD